eukprot:gene19024-25618_t
MASSDSTPAPALPPAVYASGDIELRFGNNQEPLRAHSVLLSLASPTVLGPLLSAEDRKASYLVVLLGSSWYFELDTFFIAMPILHKYDFSALLKHAAGLVKSEVAWGQGSKTKEHNVGEWLWLIDEPQLVGMHDAFQKLIKGLPRSRLCGIAHEVTNAAAPSKRISAAGMVMAEFDPTELEMAHGATTCPHCGNRSQRPPGALYCPMCGCR